MLLGSGKPNDKLDEDGRSGYTLVLVRYAPGAHVRRDVTDPRNRSMSLVGSAGLAAVRLWARGILARSAVRRHDCAVCAVAGGGATQTFTTHVVSLGLAKSHVCRRRLAVAGSRI